jgi:hypothetical protein
MQRVTYSNTGLARACRMCLIQLVDIELSEKLEISFLCLKGQSHEIFRVFLQQSSIDQNQERRR